LEPVNGQSIEIDEIIGPTGALTSLVT